MDNLGWKWMKWMGKNQNIGKKFINLLTNEN